MNAFRLSLIELQKSSFSNALYFDQLQNEPEPIDHFDKSSVDFCTTMHYICYSKLVQP